MSGKMKMHTFEFCDCLLEENRRVEAAMRLSLPGTGVRWVSTLDFLVLGSLEVRIDGRSIAVGGPRQRTVLAMLLLAADRVVSVDSLVEAVWNGRPPATGRGQVAICVAGLRKIFRQAGCLDDVINTVPPGYMLVAGDHRIDAREFAALISQARVSRRDGRMSESADLLSEAVALWRGAALDGISSPVVMAEAARLEEQRRAAHEQRAGLMLGLGLHQRLIGELTALVREQPLREHERAHLMLALYRSGRRAEALEVYREGHRRSIEELGLKPGAALQELHEEILRDEPRLTLPLSLGPTNLAVAPAQLPAAASSFTGRHAELADLDALLRDRSDDRPPGIGLITGPAGVGKTCLAVHWAHLAASVFTDGQLFVNLQGHDENNGPATADDIVDRFLRALGVHSGQMGGELSERVALYRSILDGLRVLIVLDNVNDFAQIQPLLPGSGGSCVLITSRDQLSELGGYGGVRLHLGVLSESEATGLLGNISGEARVKADPAGAARLGELCDRLPLALQIAAARLASKPHWTIADLVSRLENERSRLDELSHGQQSVRASFWLSYRYLQPAAAMLYRRLSILDVPDFPSWVGAALLDIDLATAENLMEHLVDAQLVEVVGRDNTGSLRYRLQSLLRLDARERALEEDDPAERRAACERALGGWLALAEQAHRRSYGGDYTVIHGGAMRWRLDQALVDRLVRDQLAWFEAERLALVAVVVQAAKMNMDELAWDLAMTSTTLFEARNYLDDWSVACTSALGATRKAGNTRGEAAMLYALGTLAAFQQRYDEAEVFLMPALQLYEHVTEPHGRALVLRNLALLDRMRGDLARAWQRCEEALKTFRLVGDRYAEAHVLGYLAQIELDRGESESSARLSEGALDISRSINSARGEAQCLYRLAQAHLMRGRLDDAAAAFQHVLRIARGSEDLLGTAYATCGLGETLLRLGRSAEAEVTLLEAQGIARAVFDRFVEGRVNLALGRLYLGLNRHDAARDHAETAHRLFAQIRSPLWEAEAQLTISVLDETDQPSSHLTR
jgi:DNA-binding SARP family transcriptional activator/tetratricopeptide (TPR) repeat protein